MTRAIGYVRRSTDRQDESLDQQRQRLHAFAESKGWELVAIHEDDAISASELSRPGLDLLRSAAQHPTIQVVIAWDRNRLARPKDALDGLLLEREVKLALRKTLLKCKLHQDTELFERAYGYTREYY